MVVDDLNVVRVAVRPPKADPPLIVDPDAVLSSTIAAQLLEPIAWRRPQILKLNRRVDMAKLPEHHAPEVGREASDRLTFPEPLGVAVSKTPNHGRIITPRVTIRKGEPGWSS